MSSSAEKRAPSVESVGEELRIAEVHNLQATRVAIRSFSDAPTPLVPKDVSEFLDAQFELLDEFVRKPLEGATTLTEFETCWTRVRQTARAVAAAVLYRLVALAVEHPHVERKLRESWRGLAGDATGSVGLRGAGIDAARAAMERCGHALSSLLSVPPAERVFPPSVGALVECVFDSEVLFYLFMGSEEASTEQRFLSQLSRRAWEHRLSVTLRFVAECETVEGRLSEPWEAQALVVYERTRKHWSRGHKDAALDLLFSHVGAWLEARCFGTCDELIDRVRQGDEDPGLAVGLLTATLPARDVLSERSHLLDETRRRLRALVAESEVEATLRGLE